jgi:hypothetical protein
LLENPQAGHAVDDRVLQGAANALIALNFAIFSLNQQVRLLHNFAAESGRRRGWCGYDTYTATFHKLIHRFCGRDARCDAYVALAHAARQV